MREEGPDDDDDDDDDDSSSGKTAENINMGEPRSYESLTEIGTGTDPRETGRTGTTRTRFVTRK